MDISAVKNPVGMGASVNLVQTNTTTQTVGSVPTEKSGDVTDKMLTDPTDDKVKNKPVDLKDLAQMTEAMNKFVQAMEANIRFVVHEKSNQLMVQVVDQANNKVLKEFPSAEFLDTIAAIRDYVGILLDKKI
ncbi:flagellar protein FlaG [Desulfosporosinus nitroreducens]|uniref:Flagellar protein FlaG n=1 Tax=Desulfosporosinus nitroreducens TaxID=2018668 RepID=A0ABT8QLS2_9FIRM|nr:flagellar protein FlaG [Desulfosporosinus nitroreducens]MDO0821822.1 flagellar protein FlaG [Desulfosporosinus nitroreducens]